MKKILLLIVFIIPLYGFNQEQMIVYFPTDKSYMLHSSKIELKKMIDSKQIKSVIKIIGYTDSTASQVYNKELAERRVLDIKYYLTTNGVSLAHNFSSKAVGEDFNQHVELSKNRKVIIKYEGNALEANQATKLKDLKKGEKLALKHLNFEPGLDQFREIAFPVLENLLETMIEREDLKIKIHGHICCTFLDDTNLSTRRALKVRNYLIENGISPNRLIHEGHGSSRPIHPLPEKNEEQMKENRRVEIEIISVKE